MLTDATPAARVFAPSTAVSGWKLAGIFVTILIVLAWLYNIGLNRQMAALNNRPAAPIPTTWNAFVDCNGCGPHINIWKNPSNTVRKLAGQIPNSSNVLVLDKRTDAGTAYYLIRLDGQEGWISELMVRIR